MKTTSGRDAVIALASGWTAAKAEMYGIARVGDNSLPDLAARIRVEHGGAKASVKRGVKHAVAAGQLLIEAKAQVQHGQWLPWLRDQCGLPDRTASAYMRVAKNKEKLAAEIGNVADLSLRGALDALTAHISPEAEQFAEWLLVRAELNERPKVISWLECCNPHEVIAHLRRRLERE